MSAANPAVRWLKRAEFAAFYLKEVLASNLRVAWDVVTPVHQMKPAMFEIDTSGLNPRQVLAVANLVSMTPGTLSIDLSEDHARLAIHGMYVDDPAAVARQIEHDYVRRIRDVF